MDNSDGITKFGGQVTDNEEIMNRFEKSKIKGPVDQTTLFRYGEVASITPRQPSLNSLAAEALKFERTQSRENDSS